MKIVITLIITGFINAVILSTIFPYFEDWLYIPLILIPVISTIFINKYFFQTNVSINPEAKQSIENHTNSLSDKYEVLKSYKVLAQVCMVASTGFFIYTIVQFGDAPKAARKMLENAMITSTVSYVITMFSLFCLTKIIDFLFDLDKQDKILAPDKTYSEEE